MMDLTVKTIQDQVFHPPKKRPLEVVKSGNYNDWDIPRKEEMVMGYQRSFIEWQEIGQKFFELNRELNHLIVLVGKKGYLKYGDRLAKCSRIFNQVRSDLENRMYNEYPAQSHTRIFYPGDKDENIKGISG